MRLALLAAVVLAAVAAAAAHGAAATSTCGIRSIGPGAVRRGNAAGPACLLRAYASCRPATFTLATYGVDTIRKETFRVIRPGSACRVAVAASFEVVPQQPRRFYATCRRVRRLAGDVVATGCTGALPATISLTGRH